MKYLFIVLSILFFNSAASQNIQDIENKIPSIAFGTERTVKVFLPERYFRDTISKFITVYVLDAQDDQVWNMVKSNIDYLVSRYSIIPAIVVGIVSENRSQEFRPGTEKLSLHIKQEIFPLIEKNYRTESFKAIVGHSWGGAYVGNTIYSENFDLFDAYIGISPSFDAIDNVILENANSFLQSGKELNKFLYFSSGDVGFEKEFEYSSNQMKNILNANKTTKLIWKCNLFTGLDHFSAFIPALNQGLIQMSRNYFADQKMIEEFASIPNMNISQQLDTFNISKKQQYGYFHRPSDAYLKNIADDFKENENYKAAIEMYQMLIENDHENVKLYFDLADTFDKNGSILLAKNAFSHFLVLAEEHKENVSASYYKNTVKYAQEKLEAYK